MRLIDADDRKLRAELTYYTCWTGIDEAPYLFAVDVLDKATTIDAVPVIRCKDCKFYYPNMEADGETGDCKKAQWFRRLQYPNDFCSRAERK